MDDEQDGRENESLRSLNSDIPTHVNFINRTEQSARLWWLDFTGQPVSYGDIRPNGSLPMDTFLSESSIMKLYFYVSTQLLYSQPAFPFDM